MTSNLAPALGHVRNAVWQLLRDEREDDLVLGLESLELEALLNQDDLEPDVVRLQASPPDSLTSARDLMASIPEQVPPAAWKPCNLRPYFTTYSYRSSPGHPAKGRSSSGGTVRAARLPGGQPEGFWPDFLIYAK